MESFGSDTFGAIVGNGEGNGDIGAIETGEELLN
jgi:hypothetical protein